MAGTITIPPPTPNNPLATPLTRPITAAMTNCMVLCSRLARFGKANSPLPRKWKAISNDIRGVRRYIMPPVWGYYDNAFWKFETDRRGHPAALSRAARNYLSCGARRQTATDIAPAENGRSASPGFHHEPDAAAVFRPGPYLCFRL